MDVHYCWFGGGDLPPLAKRCLESWEQYVGAASIKRWDESNVDLESPIVKKALKEKMWAFASDYVRLKVLYEHGGLYLDTDVELISSLEKFEEFQCVIGEESSGVLNAAFLMAKPKNEFIKLCIGEMESRHSRGEFYTTIPRIVTDVFNCCDDASKPTIFPSDYFYPYNPYDNGQDVKQLMYRDITKNTVAIHHWEKSWSVPFYRKIINFIRKV